MNRVSEITGLPPSPIDIEVLARLGAGGRVIYSAGISTGGIFEIAAALAQPERKIIATTIDKDGMSFTLRKIADADSAFCNEGPSIADRISVRNEDLTKKLSPSQGTVDLAYSRLALHYLEPTQRADSVRKLADITRAGGAVVIAVRSSESLELNPNVISFDRSSGRAEIRRPDGSVLVQVRHLPTLEDLRHDMENAGLEVVGGVQRRLEPTCEDFARSKGGDLDRVLFSVGRKPKS